MTLFIQGSNLGSNHAALPPPPRPAGGHVSLEIRGSYGNGVVPASQEIRPHKIDRKKLETFAPHLSQALGLF